MKKLNIENKFLTSYYLEQKFGSESEETGLKFIEPEDENGKEKIELHYKDEKDLEEKLSYILMILTDK